MRFVGQLLIQEEKYCGLKEWEQKLTELLFLKEFTLCPEGKVI